MAAKVAIGLGGNIGDVPRRFEEACARLQMFLEQLTMAPLFYTKPVDCVPGTPDFCNSAVTGLFDGTPLELLAICQKLEREFGRPAEHSSRESRTLDLDILLFGEAVVALPNLVVPHPRLLQRRFALEPLAAIAGDWLIPPKMQTVADCLCAVTSSN